MEVHQLAQIMQNKHTIKEDLNDAIGLINAMFHDRYFSKINREMEAKRQYCEKNPSNEVKLLRSIKPFMGENHHNTIDKTIAALTMIQTFQKMGLNMPVPNSEISIQSTPRRNRMRPDPSVHQDGVYDIDAKCTPKNRSISQPLIGVTLLLALSQSNTA